MDERIDFEDAIASQPRWMSKTAQVVDETLSARGLPGWTVLGPHRRASLAVVGMGASTHAGAVFVAALRAAGVRAVNLDASAAAGWPDRFHVADVALVISESGRSPEPIAAARRLGVPVTAVTNVLNSPLGQIADLVVPLGGFTDSGVYTIGYTTTLVALAALARAAGIDAVPAPAGLADVAQTALADFAAPARALARRLVDCRFMDVVGRGTSLGSAQAVGLLMREAAHVPTTAFETVQYLHGPMESAAPDGCTLLFGDGRETGIATQLRASGMPAIQVLTTPDASASGEDVYRLSKPAEGYAGAVAEIIFAQLLAAELAKLRKIQVGAWRFPQPDTKLPVSTA